MKTLMIACASFALISACAVSSDASPATAESASTTAAKASPTDFALIEGGGWTGQMTYLDYTTQKPSSIPVALNVKPATGRTVTYEIMYPRESKYNATEKLKLSKDGTRLNGNAIIERTVQDDDSVQIVTLERGKDDNRDADIRTTYKLSESALTISKDVKFDDGYDFFQRNILALTR